jgi:hypothetical protein
LTILTTAGNFEKKITRKRGIEKNYNSREVKYTGFTWLRKPQLGFEISENKRGYRMERAEAKRSDARAVHDEASEKGTHQLQDKRSSGNNAHSKESKGTSWQSTPAAGSKDYEGAYVAGKSPFKEESAEAKKDFSNAYDFAADAFDNLSLSTDGNGALSRQSTIASEGFASPTVSRQGTLDEIYAIDSPDYGTGSSAGYSKIPQGINIRGILEFVERHG